MKRILVLLSLLILIAMPISLHDATQIPSELASPPLEQPPNQAQISYVSHEGSNRDTAIYASRDISSYTLRVSNSYGSISQHTGEINLSQYQIPGWSLYRVEISPSLMQAIPEHESTGITPNNDIQITNSSGLVTDSLYQEFYNQPYDGKLINFTILYSAPYYLLSLGKAYLVIRSDYSDPSTNTTSWTTPFTQTLTDTYVTQDCQADNAILNEFTPYYAVIDGENLIGVYSGGWKFNQVYWKASNLLQGTKTGYHIRDDMWYQYNGSGRQEAYLTYVYNPWNTTTDSALEYNDATQVALLANTSAVSGSKWVFSNNNGLTRIDFQSNESVDIDCSLVLWYRQDSMAVVNWAVDSSGSIVKWNITATTEYPKSADQRFLNYSLPATWMPTGLFSSSTPSSNHSYYSISADTVTCSNMSNETWTLMASSYNHVLQISIFNSGDNSPISEVANGNWILEINTTMADENEMPVATGTTNLTIWKDNQVVYSPANKTASNGETSYSWDIASITSDNGLFRIEVYWTNDTEAGYLSRDLVIYHSTTLTPAQSHVQGFTEAAVEIRVDYEDAYNSQGINGTLGSVSYSFDGSSNTTMTDLANGTWVGLISTAGENPGTYIADVYATGFALENQTSAISITLIHQTKNLTVQWSATNNITSVEHTDLIVVYQRTSGENVTGAEVNVTIDSTTWTLRWDSSNNYYVMRFNGTDNDPGFGTHSTIISAWKTGYESQTDTTHNITLREEPTSISVQWSAGNSITYIGATTVSISYRMSNSTPIPFATANITIGGIPYILIYDAFSQTYNFSFYGNETQPGFGVYTLDIRIGKTGYEGQTNTEETLSISEEPTSLTIQWTNTNTITYVQQTILRVNYTMSNGSAVAAALLNFTIDTTTDSLYWDEGYGSYIYIFHGDDSFPGFGFHNIIILADKYGYVYRMNDTQTITVSGESTTLVVSVFPDSDVTYTQYSTVIVEYRMSNNSAVTGAIVNMTLGTGQWLLRWDSINQDYRIRINGSDSPPGFGTFTVAVGAACYGFENQTDSSNSVTLRREPTVLIFQWSNGNNISFVDFTILQVNYSRTSGISISDALVNVTIDSTTWDLTWNGTSGFYEIRFNGTDTNPGFGNHSITIKAQVFGFEGRTNSTGNLVLREEFTSLTHSWVSSNTITYVGQTTLNVTYRMSNGTAIPNTILNVTINSKTWPLLWNGSTQSYVLTFNGTDTLPGFGLHSLVILADKFGYVGKTDDSDSLEIDLEGTSLTVELIPDNDITFTESSVLIADYEMSNGSAVIGAEVNVTIDSNIWTLVWDSGNQYYRIQLNGSDIPPGFGTYNIIVRAGLYGYIQQMNNSLDVTLRIEPTSFSIQWSNGNDLSYFDSTVLQVNYTMTGNTPIPSAEVNATIGLNTWVLHWNSTSGFFELRFNGSDVTPGVGTHSLSIKAWLYGYEGQSDTSQTLTLPVIPTSMVIIWTNGYDISYVESTTLIVNYTLFNGTVVTAATVNVTFGLTTWDLAWNASIEAYEVTFNGNEDPPGIAAYSLTIKASRTDFQGWVDTSQTLSVSSESTSYEISWTSGFNISYLESTTLSLSYKMSNGTAIPNAVVVVTLASTPLTMKWNGARETYEITFNGTDAFPGFGTYPLVIQGSKFGYVSVSDNSEELTVRVEDTSLVLTWTAGPSISYISETILRAEYLLRDFSMVNGATINVTIDGHTWQMNWNATSGYYQIKFKGTDTLPGLGAHAITVSAWKQDYQAHVDTSHTLTINKENTSLSISWSDGSTITYVEYTMLSVNYRMSNGSAIELATVNVTIASTTWMLRWNTLDKIYVIQFNGTDADPGLGTHGLLIQAGKYGYQQQTNISLTLKIIGELGQIDSKWLNTGIISYVGFTVLSVNYTMSNGTAIALATVNVTIGTSVWQLRWYEPSETYRIQLNGTDDPPGLGVHSLVIKAWRQGFDYVEDTSMVFTINEEATLLIPSWSSPYLNNISYFQSTILRVTYQMSNGTDITGATVNVTVSGSTWQLTWNATGKYYDVKLNGSDIAPGFGTLSITIRADAHGYQYLLDNTQGLTVRKDLSTIEVAWPTGYNITYIEHTKIVVYYKMSNGTAIPDGVVNITIAGQPYALTWNSTSEAYERVFYGTQNPPGLGTFVCTVKASGPVYSDQIANTLFVIRTEMTSVSIWWVNAASDSNSTFYYSQSDVIRVYYRNSLGNAITGATVKTVTVNGTPYTLTEDTGNGYYWHQFTYLTGLGYHVVTVNMGKSGYEYAFLGGIHYNIAPNPTQLYVTWDAATIDYLGQVNLTAQYWDVNLARDVSSPVTANLTIDGLITIPLNSSGKLWIANLTGMFLDLGVHSILVRAWRYGFQYQENMTVITVNSVQTDMSYISWQPSNVTIQYTQSLNLTLDYSFASGDVPDSAQANLTINGITYDLVYTGSSWFVSVPGIQIGLGVYDAHINAWLYGYETFTNTTYGVNVTLASNSFLVTWEPSNGIVDIIDEVNISVIYTSDYLPILDATVTVTFNKTSTYPLVYNPLDQEWHITLTGFDLTLGIWNATILANRTGQQPGTEWKLFTIHRDTLQTSTSWLSTITDYVSSKLLDVKCNSSEGQAVDDATVSIEVGTMPQDVVYRGFGLYTTTLGPYIGPGTYTVNVTISGDWFYSTTLLLTLYVNETLTSLDISFSNTAIYTDGAITGSLSYVMLNGSDVPSGAAEILVDGISVLPQWNGVNWSFAIKGDAISPGNYECHVNTTSFGFESQSYKFNLSIHLIPTDYEISERNWLYVNDTLEIQIRYVDSRTNISIEGAPISIDWTGAYVLTTEPAGLYALQLSSDALHSGNYSLQIGLAQDGCESISVTYTIIVRPLPIEIVCEPTLTQYEQEYVRIVAYLVDNYHRNNVTWGTLIAVFQGVEYDFLYNTSSETYSASIMLDSGVTPGDYQILLKTEVPDFEQAVSNLTLTVLEKMTYTLSLAIPAEADEGNQITISATLLHGSSPVGQKTIAFHILIEFQNSSSSEVSIEQKTNSSGSVAIIFSIPRGADHLQVSAAYMGEIDAWSTTTENRTIRVLQSSTEPRLPLLDPFSVSLVVGGSASMAVILVLVRRRRHTISYHSAASSMTTSLIDTSPSLVTSLVSDYTMLPDGSLAIKDLADSLSETMGISGGLLERYEAYLTTMGITTLVIMEKEQREKARMPDDEGLPVMIRNLLRESGESFTRQEIANALNVSLSKTMKAVSELLKADSTIMEYREGKDRKIQIRKPR